MINAKGPQATLPVSVFLLLPLRIGETCGARGTNSMYQQGYCYNPANQRRPR